MSGYFGRLQERSACKGRAKGRARERAEKLKVPTGAKALRLVDDFGKLVAEINPIL